jgi:hypothetical protein
MILHSRFTLRILCVVADFMVMCCGPQRLCYVSLPGMILMFEGVKNTLSRLMTKAIDVGS